ncbi:hypothetical protein BH11PSE11_BH11PSE11_11220 [soil metagenome]
MYIVYIAWLYVVLLMSFTEQSVVAGCMTFLFYGALPLVIILYLSGFSQRKRKRLLAESLRRDQAVSAAGDAGDLAKEPNEAASPAEQETLLRDPEKK